MVNGSPELRRVPSEHSEFVFSLFTNPQFLSILFIIAYFSVSSLTVKMFLLMIHLFMFTMFSLDTMPFSNLDKTEYILSMLSYKVSNVLDVGRNLYSEFYITEDSVIVYNSSVYNILFGSYPPDKKEIKVDDITSYSVGMSLLPGFCHVKIKSKRTTIVIHTKNPGKVTSIFTLNKI